MSFEVETKFTPNDAIRSRLVQALISGVRQGAQLVAEEAKSIVPYDTGALHDSIEAHEPEQDRDTRGTGLAVTATVTAGGGDVDYAPYVEFGTGQRGAGSAGAGEGPYSPTWPGQAAQPYMRPAVTTTREAVLGAISAELEAVL